MQTSLYSLQPAQMILKYIIMHCEKMSKNIDMHFFSHYFNEKKEMQAKCNVFQNVRKPSSSHFRQNTTVILLFNRQGKSNNYGVIIFFSPLNNCVNMKETTSLYRLIHNNPDTSFYLYKYIQNTFNWWFLFFYIFLRRMLYVKEWKL